MVITLLMEQAESGGSVVPSRRTGQQGGTEQFVMLIPNNKVEVILSLMLSMYFIIIKYVLLCYIQVGLIIGKGGETIKNMQSNSGARIQVYWIYHSS